MEEENKSNTVRFGIRRMTPGDISAVASTWRRSIRRHCYWTTGMTDEVFHSNHRELINRTLEWSPALVAYDIDCPDLHLGFLVGGVFNGYPVVHYVYTKHPFRQYGIAKTLLEHLGWKPGVPVITTHIARSLVRYYGSHKGLIYNPYLLFKEFRDEVLHAEPVQDDRIYVLDVNETRYGSPQEARTPAEDPGASGNQTQERDGDGRGRNRNKD